MTDCEKDITYQFIKTLTLLTWCRYDSSGTSPSFDYVVNRGSAYFMDDEEETDERKKWKTTLQKYEYRHTDSLDLVLAETVCNGYFAEDRIMHEITKRKEEVCELKSRQSFSDAWNLYHDTFADNKNELVSAFHESISHSAKYLSPLDLNSAVKLVRELGEPEKASELIDIYINQRSEEEDLFNVDEIHFMETQPDIELTSKFNLAYSNIVVAADEKAKQVLARITSKNSWNHNDLVILANTTVNEYYELFKSESGRHLRSYVATCLQFGGHPDANDEKKKLLKK